MASSSYNQSPSSSSVLTSPPAYDVFLSFRGVDTRYTFIDYLYDALGRYGIRTFKDDRELCTGDVISDSLLKAIQGSKTYVVVFSENYASSTWCLDELVEIMGCYKSMGRSIFPVYYNIEPSAVRHQTGSFDEAFREHGTQFHMDRLSKWRITLTSMAGLTGYNVHENMSQTDIINKIVDRILLEINPLTLDVAKYPVGLDPRVKALTTLLSSGTEGVIRIGIHGMGGVGKTTLAKAVYNQNIQGFQGSCFLANVREVLKRENGLVCLQQKLMDTILKRKSDKIDNVDQGIELIRARICSKKVLIVIDDLDSKRPLEFLEGPFALGSIIIITTRNEDLLDSIKVEAKYKVNELGDAESCLLFAQHAFGDIKIPDTFMELSREILGHAGGLPLALKVFGSNLLNQPVEEWSWFIDKLKRVSIEDVENKLAVSFEALNLVDPMLQNFYLDIACFFIGYKKEIVAKIMETCYTFVDHNFDILRKRCLLTTNGEDELQMHDLLRDMGKKIARNNSFGEPGKHSRLWASKDICDVLKNNKGAESLECIIPRDNQDAFDGVSFTTETFKSMNKLRFLCLEKVLHDFEKLKTLNMSYSLDLSTTPDFSNLPCLENLNFEYCACLEEVHVSIGSLERLVSLNLHGCVNLRSLQDSICNLRGLQCLNIGGCSRLEALPFELGNIESLTELKAWGLSVSEIPESIGRLSKLVELELNNNKSLEYLPDTICNLRSLEILDVNDCSSLEALPDWIGLLGKLVELRLSCNKNLETRPNTICNLRSLEILDISECEKLEILPDQLWKLTSLWELDARGVPLLKELPDIELSQIPLALQRLDLTGSALTALPYGTSQLTNLEDLVLKGCDHLLSITELPPNLKRIMADDCSSLERLPNLSELKQLRNLHLAYCVGLPEIVGLDELPSLRELDLGRRSSASASLGNTFTKRLFQIYCGFGHLIHICVSELPYWISQSSTLGSTFSLDVPPNVLGMILCFKHLGDWDNLHNSDPIEYSVKNTTSGFTLQGSFDNFRFDSFMVILPRSLISNSDDGDRIQLRTTNADILGIHLLYKHEIPMIDHVLGKHMTSFDELKLVTPVLQDIFLDLACFFVGRKKDEVVQILETYYCNVERNIDILKEKWLLVINDRDELRMDDLLQHMGRNIAHKNTHKEHGQQSRLWLSLDIYDVLKKQKGAEAIEGIIPRKAYYRDALMGESFTTEAFKNMCNLRFLYLKKVNLTGSFEQTFENLRWLYWEFCTLNCLPSDFDPQKLVILELPHSNMRSLWELNKVSRVFEKLKTLNMSFSQNLSSTPDFTKLPCLEILNFESCKSLEELHISIGSLVSLVCLNLNSCVKLRSLPDTICDLTALKVLNISQCSSLGALPTELGNIESLEKLFAWGVPVSVLSDSIGRLSKLVELIIRYNKNIETLPDTICNLRSLEILDISGCETLDILPDQLWKLTRLKKLYACGILLEELPDIDSNQIALSLQNLDLSNSCITAMPSGISQLLELHKLDLIGCCELMSIEELPPNLRRIIACGCISLERLPNLSNLKQLEILDLTNCSGLTEILSLEVLTSLRELYLGGCSPSLLAYTFTKSLFQIYSEFGHQIIICIWSEEFPKWISQGEYGTTMSLDLAPNMAHNYLGMILCFKCQAGGGSFLIDYSLKTSASNFIKSDTEMEVYGACMIIVPRSIFSVRDGDNRIELTAGGYAEISGLHLLYKTENCRRRKRGTNMLNSRKTWKVNEN
ncbi:TMV resistance protein N isoform X3 [Daucus carota subsp. sativus]|uniref:TMV resistance protein N isoform X3 n=1 Tax=Daucus carota subsp. sativus TaxID=79200 RepID=UPI0030829F49